MKNSINHSHLEAFLFHLGCLFYSAYWSLKLFYVIWNIYLFYGTILKILIILRISTITLKSTLPNFKFRFHDKFLCSFYSSRNIAICIICLTIESTLRHNLIIRQRNTFCSQTFFLIKLLSVIWSALKFATNLKLSFGFITLIFFSSCWNVILMICTLSFKSSFW